MHVIVNITTKQSHCVHNNNIAVFVVQYKLCGRAYGPARARGLGPGLGLKYDNCVAGRAWIYFLRAGPGPGLIIQFAGRAQARSAQLLRARAGPGPGPGRARAGPGPHIIFAGRAWA